MAKRTPKPEPTIAPEVLDHLHPRFDAIGPWQLSVADDGVLVEWERPPSLADLGFKVAVEFETDTESGTRDPDERMLELWGRFFGARHRHAEHFRREMIAVYRENQPYFFEFEREEFPADLPDAGVLGHIRGTIRVRRQEYEGDLYYDLEASFAAAWDGEHAWTFDYDEESDSFGESGKS